MSDSDSFETAVLVIVIIAGAIVTIFLICFKRWLDVKRKRQNPESDTEILDRSIEIHDGNCIETLGDWLFSSCYSVQNDTSSGQEHELDGSAERIKELLQRAAAAATGVQHSTGPVSKYDIKNALLFLQRLQQTETKEESSETIRMAQNILLLQQSKPTENSLQTALVIGVDATPNVMGGYCVNLKDKTLEYYVIKTDDYPWTIEKRDNPKEFEMKNLQLACLIWGKRIRKYKKFRIYTDNNAIADPSNEFGSDADDLLDHFQECEDAELVNDQVHVNRKQNLEFFAKYIMPADDFSRWHIDKGIDFLCQFYGIEKKNVRGTHKLTRAASTETRAWYDASGVYQETIQRAQTFARNLKCENCIFSFMDPTSQASKIRGRQRKALQKKKKPGDSLRQILHQNNTGRCNRGRGLKWY
ncbi:unnamed protein product [Orchesella dallaii]|uniref:Reverse transcriptase RNase H-like domain-containing protein n=1 Tax=Orchesella dallaii TaxID=48710 RepID=A0ABP1QI36_9HEXA